MRANWNSIIITINIKYNANHNLESAIRSVVEEIVIAIILKNSYKCLTYWKASYFYRNRITNN